ncbi:hypothetical protein ACLB2K_059408 [Fragaria x ananassa]
MAANAVTVGNNGEVEKANSQQIQMAIGRFLYEIQAPLDAVKNSLYFQPMIDAIASGGMESKAPSYHDLWGWILNDAAEEVKNEIYQHTNSWERNGCSLLVNQFNSEKGRILLNFSVYCPEGTTYLKSVDASTFSIASREKCTRVHKNKEHAYVDPISFENTGVVEDWVTEPEMYLENDENTDWKTLDPPSYNSRLLELSVDEGEDLGSGFDDYEIFFNGLQVVKEEGRA